MRLLLIGLLLVAGALMGELQPASAQPAGPPASAQTAGAAAGQAKFLPGLEPRDERFWIILALLLLMGGLFFILFWWQKHIEQAGYFANIYRDTLASIETSRLSQPYQRNWDQGLYWDEITDQPSERGQKWLDQDSKNKKPTPKSDLTKLAEKLGRTYELLDLEMMRTVPPGLGRNPFSETGNPIGAYGSGTGRLGASEPGDSAKEQLTEDQKRFTELFDEFRNEAAEWKRRAKVQAWSFYQDDLKGAQKEGRKQAKRALKVDLSALRGRGPEFVLEFTAIVVIIFAAVILGVAGLLSDQQIGTLLAAIAGYVLGKSVARGSSGQTEEPSGPDQGGRGGGRAAANE